MPEPAGHHATRRVAVTREGVKMLHTGTRSGYAVLLLLALLLVPWSGTQAAAEEDERGLETRFLRIGALTMGKTYFGGEATPPVLPHSVSNEESPLFGWEGEEPIYPVGMGDEVVELIKNAVQPATWEMIAGADLRVLDDHLIVARAPSNVLDEVAVFLAERERNALGSLRVEVQAVRIEPGQAAPRDASGIGMLLRSPAAGPHLALVASSSQRVSAMSGRQMAYVSEYDTEVAQEATISDPAVAVANLGLLVDVRAEPGARAGHWLAHSWIRLADLQSLRTVSAGEGRPLEVPAFDTAELHVLLDLSAGQWSLAGTSGGWAFYVRAVPLPYAPGTGTPAVLPTFPEARGAMRLRYYDVHDLSSTPLWSVADAPYHLWPSNFAPPASPELREPTPYMPPESLVELLMSVGGGSVWEDPATIEARNAMLIVRTDAGTHAGVTALLAAMRRELLWSLQTRVEVLKLPADLATQILAAPTLEGELAAALVQGRREGRVHVVGQAEVHHRRMTRTTTQAGTHRLYLQDYEAEIAQAAAISNPVTQVLFSGLTVDLLGNLTSAGDAAALEVRFTQTRLHEPMRTLQTPNGAIELPEMDVLRVRSSMVVPLEATVALAAAGEGDHRRVILLTPRLVRAR